MKDGYRSNPLLYITMDKIEYNTNKKLGIRK